LILADASGIQPPAFLSVSLKPAGNSWEFCLYPCLAWVRDAQVFRCWDAEMLKCSGVQMFRCSGVEMLRCSGYL
jgi:hypothetical protein